MTALGLLLLALSPVLAVMAFGAGLILTVEALGFLAGVLTAAARMQAAGAVEGWDCLLLARARASIWLYLQALRLGVVSERVTRWGCGVLDGIGAWLVRR